MTKVNGPQNNGTPAGYTKIKMYDEASKKTKTFFIPVGKKIKVNGKEHDPSVKLNNETVFTGKKGENGFEMLGLALERMDVNKDGKIDKKDTDFEIASKLNKDLDAKKIKYSVRDGEMSDAGVYKGEGGVTFRDNKNPINHTYNVEIYGDD